jgi:crotonobetaine/carnitine-CoA ligase
MSVTETFGSARRTVPAVLSTWAARTPDKLAVRDYHATYTYAELVTAGQCLAGGLRALGVGRGDRVLLLLDNDCDYVLSWIGLSFLAAVEVPVNTAYKQRMLSYVVNDSGATVLVVQDTYLPRVAEVLPDLVGLEAVVVRGDASGVELPGIRVVAFEEVKAGDAVEIEHVDPWDPVAVMYTSGTTGPSKGVLVTHGHAFAYCTPEYWGAADADDVTLVALPLFHVGGQWAGVYNALIVGASAVVVPRFAVSTYWDDVRRFGCTYTLMLGAIATFLNAQPPAADDRDVPMRRALMVPVIPEVREFEERFGLAIGTAFGMTETASPLFMPFGQAVPGGAGYLRADYEARIVDEHDREVGVDVVGELVLRPKEPWAIMAGYLNKPEATAEAWRNLWFHTGDAFRKDADGQYFFVDRVKDAIRCRGENVSSFEVETEVLAYPGVLECAAVGLASANTEQEIKIVIVPDDGATIEPEHLVLHLARKLPYFMVPRYVEIVAEIPKTPTQKIRKQVLRDQGVGELTWDRVAAGVVVNRDS